MPKRGSIEAPASLLKRFSAYIIDFIIINIVIIYPFRRILRNTLPEKITALELHNIMQTDGQISTILFTIASIVGLLSVAYFTIFEYRLQQTPGKMLMKNKIIPVKGKKLTFWNYLFSNLTFIPFFPFFLLWVIDPIYMIFSPKNQRFMEKLSNIIVVERYKL